MPPLLRRPCRPQPRANIIVCHKAALIGVNRVRQSSQSTPADMRCCVHIHHIPADWPYTSVQQRVTAYWRLHQSPLRFIQYDYFSRRGFKVCRSACLYVCLFACLSARIFQHPHVQISRTFLYMLPVTVTRPTFDNNATAYVHYLAQFRADRSDRCGYIAVFLIFRPPSCIFKVGDFNFPYGFEGHFAS